MLILLINNRFEIRKKPEFLTQNYIIIDDNLFDIMYNYFTFVKKTVFKRNVHNMIEWRYKLATYRTFHVQGWLDIENRI